MLHKTFAAKIAMLNALHNEQHLFKILYAEKVRIVKNNFEKHNTI